MLCATTSMRVKPLLALMLSVGGSVTPRRVNAEEAERSHILHTLEQTEGLAVGMVQPSGWACHGLP